MFSGRALDAGIFKPIFFLGLALQIIGIFTTSIVPLKFWHIILSQGISQGIGNGLQFCPTVALLSTYFSRHRSIAIGIAASGSSLGGLVYPSIVRSLLPRLGFAWTVRVCGFVMLAVGLIAGLGLRTRRDLPPRKTGPLLELRAFREPTYALFCAGMFLVFFGLFFAFYYVASFATGVVGLPTEKAFALLMVMNAAGFVFRLLPGLLADRLTGPLNLMLPFAFATAMLTYSWSAVKSPLGTWIWAIFYGLIAAGVQGLFPAVLSSLTTDLTKQGVRMGMGFAIVGVAGATGPPVAGAIIQACGGRYIGAQMWAGTSILLGVCFLLAARTVKVGWQLKRI
jgi:MFS family permease